MTADADTPTAIYVQKPPLSGAQISAVDLELGKLLKAHALLELNGAFMKAPEVALVLRCSLMTVHRKVKAGKLPAPRAAGDNSKVFRSEEIREHLDNLPVAPAYINNAA